MTTLVAVGAQWGDEGKGKLVDWLAPQAQLVVRFQGGNNAGHTLVVEGEQTVLHDRDNDRIDGQAGLQDLVAANMT